MLFQTVIIQGGSAVLLLGREFDVHSAAILASNVYVAHLRFLLVGVDDVPERNLFSVAPWISQHFLCHVLFGTAVTSECLDVVVVCGTRLDLVGFGPYPAVLLRAGSHVSVLGSSPVRAAAGQVCGRVQNDVGLVFVDERTRLSGTRID